MVEIALTDEGSLILVSVRQLLTLFDSPMCCTTLPPGPVISVCIRRYPERKDESVPRTTFGSAGSRGM